MMLTMTLKRFMSENNIRTKDLAGSAGISEAYLSQIRHGIRRPSPDVAKRISDACGIPVLDLLFPEQVDRQDSGEAVSDRNHKD